VPTCNDHVGDVRACTFVATDKGDTDQQSPGDTRYRRGIQNVCCDAALRFRVLSRFHFPSRKGHARGAGVNWATSIMEEALASLTRNFASNADAAKPDDEQATQTGASAHGGQSYSFKQDMVTPREKGSERGSSAASAGWTVHSGDFFARAVNTGQGRAPQERSYLNSHDPVPKAASMGVKFPPVSPLERQQMRELNFSRERLALLAGENALRLRELSLLRKAEIATPPHLHVSNHPLHTPRIKPSRCRTASSFGVARRCFAVAHLRTCMLSCNGAGPRCYDRRHLRVPL